MALVLTLVVITILAFLVLEFNYLMRVEASIAENYRDSLKAYYLAHSGVNFAYCLLRDDNLSYDSLDEKWALAEIPVDIAEGEVTFRIEDENAKINVNLLKGVKERQEQLIRLCGLLNEQYGRHAPISSSIVPVIIDWTDDDDEIEVLEVVFEENKGAEDEYYRALEDPYPCKNRPLDTLEEVLLVKGMTDEIFFGRRPNKEKGIEPTSGLGDYLTIYGSGRININTASFFVLESLHKDIDASLAQEIIKYRQAHPFKKTTDLKAVSGISDDLYKEISPLISVKSDFFSVSSQGITGETRKRIRAIVERKNKSLQIKYWRVI
jgi:general secretion pathway protein K